MFRRLLILAGLLPFLVGFRPMSGAVTVPERMPLCGTALEEHDPAEYLPDELPILLLDECTGIRCPARCCVQSGCCDPSNQVCCDVTCIYVCLQIDQCPTC